MFLIKQPIKSIYIIFFIPIITFLLKTANISFYYEMQIRKLIWNCLPIVRNFLFKFLSELVRLVGSFYSPPTLPFLRGFLYVVRAHSQRPSRRFQASLRSRQMYRNHRFTAERSSQRRRAAYDHIVPTNSSTLCNNQISKYFI